MSESTFSRIEAGRERWNVLRHPFYRRWSEGLLTRGELARYSGQYRHAVVAIARLSEAAAAELPDRPELRAHAEEEEAHVRLWDGFLEAVGGSASDAPTAETRQCLDAWRGADAHDALARLYAVEHAQPAISLTKRAGLLEHYGFGDGPATEYFAVHASRDCDHAAEVRELIGELATPADTDRLAAAGEAALRANWRLLDGV